MIESLATVVRRHVLAACVHHGWKLPLVAASLGVSLKTVYNHLSRYEREGHVRRTAGGWRTPDVEEVLATAG